MEEKRHPLHCPKELTVALEQTFGPWDQPDQKTGWQHPACGGAEFGLLEGVPEDQHLGRDDREPVCSRELEFIEKGSSELRELELQVWIILEVAAVRRGHREPFPFHAPLHLHESGHALSLGLR